VPHGGQKARSKATQMTPTPWERSWQPIETAPKDGTRILLWDTDEVVIAKWDDISTGGAKGWQIAVVNMHSNLNYYEAAYNPTHWMPLPEPPYD
jgi:hypothetical protein